MVSLMMKYDGSLRSGKNLYPQKSRILATPPLWQYIILTSWYIRTAGSRWVGPSYPMGTRAPNQLMHYFSPHEISVTKCSSV